MGFPKRAGTSLARSHPHRYCLLQVFGICNPFRRELEGINQEQDCVKKKLAKRWLGKRGRVWCGMVGSVDKFPFGVHISICKPSKWRVSEIGLPVKSHLVLCKLAAPSLLPFYQPVPNPTEQLKQHILSSVFSQQCLLCGWKFLPDTAECRTS